jgi:thiol-disulfide isomerase/thioredoxin
MFLVSNHTLKTPTMQKNANIAVRHVLFLIFCVILLADDSMQASGLEMPNAALGKADSLTIGDPVKPFVMRDIITDAPVFLRDYIGKRLRRGSKQTEQHVVVLSFWATWCEPCKVEIPLLTEMAKEFEGQPVKIFLVNTMEYAGVTEEAVREEYIKRGYTLQCLVDASGRVARLNTVRGLPMIVVIGKDGTIQKVNRGFHEDFDVELKEKVAELLKETVQ